MALSINDSIGNNSTKQRLLHGSDVPKQFDGVVVKVKEVRKAPANFNSPFIIDFAEPLPYGCQSWALNVTNAVILSRKIGDDLEAINGRRLYLKKIQVNNPATGELVTSLEVSKVEGEKAPKVDTTAKKAKDAKPPKVSEGIKESDLPF